MDRLIHEWLFDRNPAVSSSLFFFILD